MYMINRRGVNRNYSAVMVRDKYSPSAAVAKILWPTVQLARRVYIKFRDTFHHDRFHCGLLII